MIYLYEMIDTRHRSYIFIFSQYYIASPTKLYIFFTYLQKSRLLMLNTTAYKTKNKNKQQLY